MLLIFAVISVMYLTLPVADVRRDLHVLRRPLHRDLLPGDVSLVSRADRGRRGRQRHGVGDGRQVCRQ
jgi:hypothetical protein